MQRLVPSVAVLTAALALAGCGTKQATTKQPATTTAASATTGTTSATTAVAQTSTAPGALQAEVKAAATGDVPDNQAFLVFKNSSAGYSMKYPEGWAQSGSGATVDIRDKNNIVRIVIQSGALPTVTAARAALAASPGATLRTAPKAMTVKGAPAIKLVYTTRSAANAVTGKRVTLVVDRYYLAHGGKIAVVDLGSPEGVDNVDAYRLMIESFRWRA